MLQLLPTDSPKLVAVKVSGKLCDKDYAAFVPSVESIITREGRIRLLAQFENFQGWELKAAWDDLKFGIRHYRDIERLALVGEKSWEKWMAMFSKPFTKATVKYYDVKEIDAAWAWLREEIH